MSELHRYVVESLIAEVRRNAELAQMANERQRKLNEIGSEEQQLSNLKADLKWAQEELERVKNGQGSRPTNAFEALHNPPLDERLQNQAEQITALEAEIGRVNAAAIETNAAITQALENKLTLKDKVIDDLQAVIAAMKKRPARKKKTARKR